jgi:two-component system cell cycle response regulator DivK
LNDAGLAKGKTMKTILIVEDVEFNIDLLIQILEDDFELIVAKDGAQGVALAEQYKPDAILMDISLPILDGYDATRIIRRSLPNLPIIGLSAHAMQGDEDKAKAAGCTDYLTKPVDEDLLLGKLSEYLG